MRLAVFFLITWLVCGIFAVMKKKLSITECTFVFLITLVISINFSWIVIEEFGWIQLTKNGVEYTAYLLNRSVITPMIMVLQFNLLEKSHTRTKVLALVILTTIILCGLNILSSYLNITSYKKWNVGYEIIYLLVLNLIVYLFYKGYKKVSDKEVKTHDAL